MPAKIKTTREKMNINDRHIEVYDQYLDGELSAALCEAFETKLKNDPLFREGYELHASIRLSIDKDGRNQLKQDLSELTVGLSLTKTKKYKPSGSKLGQWIFKLIVALAIVGGFYYWFVLKESKEPIIPEEEKIEEVIPTIEDQPHADPAPSAVQNKIKQEVQVIHDTIYMFENENGTINAEEMGKLIKQGAVTVDTIYETQVDTVYQIQ